jgi:hypothetical protein
MATGESIAAPACPKCGAPTIRRPVRRGPRAGLEMWGCSRYPECMGAINIDPEPAAAPVDPDAPPVAGLPAAYLQARFERARQVDRLKRRAALPLFVALVVLGMSIAFYGLQPFGVVVASTGAVITGGVGMFGLLRLPFDSLIWARGIEGERKAGDVLSKLAAEGYITLYNRRAPTARGDIDAITFGPTGIFTIETKNWSGRVEVHRNRLFVGEHDRTWAVEQLYREALAVQLALADELTAHRVTVTPILCALGGIARGGARTVSGVAIADAKTLAGLLRDRPIVFDDEQILVLAKAADARLGRAMPWDAKE